MAIIFPRGLTIQKGRPFNRPRRGPAHSDNDRPTWIQRIHDITQKIFLSLPGMANDRITEQTRAFWIISLETICWNARSYSLMLCAEESSKFLCSGLKLVSISSSNARLSSANMRLWFSNRVPSEYLRNSLTMELTRP